MTQVIVRRLPSSNNELYHFGILGQSWGKRRYQNEDGSLTPAGRLHYGYGAPRSATAGEVRVVRKANTTGGEYNSNSLAMDTGFDRGRRASSISNPRMKYKGAKNQDDQIYITDDDTLQSRKQLKNKSADYSYINENKGGNAIRTSYPSEHNRRSDEKEFEYGASRDLYRNTNLKKYLDHSIESLKDKKVDELRDLEVRAIGSGYIDMVRSKKSSSKQYARMQNDPKSTSSGYGVSPYLQAHGGLDSYDRTKADKLLQNIIDTEEYYRKHPKERVR